MLEIKQLTSGQVADLRRLLAQQDSALEADVSNYARGRQRYWLCRSWDLQKRQFGLGVEAPELWALCCDIAISTFGFEPEIGLVAKGVVGIKTHRDDSYAAFKAVSIQIGSAVWSYDRQYPAYTWVPRGQMNPSNPQLYRLQDCIVQFNCKNPHGATPMAPNRYSINLWRISDKFRAEYQTALG